MTAGWQALGDLGSRQLRLIEQARTYLRKQREKGVDVAVAPECYLCGWSRVPGNARLRALAGEPGSGARVAGARMKEAFNVARHSGYEVQGPGTSSGAFARMVVSWSRRGDFAADGTFDDRYFRTSSRQTPDTLWLVIATDAAAAPTPAPNVRVFQRRPDVPKLDMAHLARRGFGALAPRGNDHGRRPEISATVDFADQIVRAVLAELSRGSFECIVVPYEAQPFQHAIFRAAKEKQPGIRTVGYLHSLLPPLPTDLIHREGAPDLLLVHGRAQAEILERHLGWPASALHTIPSLRYRRDDAALLGGLIFLPYSFGDAHCIERAFRDFLSRSAPGSLPPLTVRNHPMMRASARHLRLQSALEGLMREHASLFASEPGARPLSVFVGATAAIFEALEHGVGVIHICSQPLTEAHSSELWEGLEVERLGEHAFRYTLAHTGTYIDFGPEGDLFERYICRLPPAHH